MIMRDVKSTNTLVTKPSSCLKSSSIRSKLPILFRQRIVLFFEYYKLWKRWTLKYKQKRREWLRLTKNGVVKICCCWFCIEFLHGSSMLNVDTVLFFILITISLRWDVDLYISYMLIFVYVYISWSLCIFTLINIALRSRIDGWTQDRHRTVNTLC